MDPNELLAQARAKQVERNELEGQLTAMRLEDDGPPRTSSTLAELELEQKLGSVLDDIAEGFKDLDEWLSWGGFMPQAWARDVRAPEEIRDEAAQELAATFQLTGTKTIVDVAIEAFELGWTSGAIRGEHGAFVRTDSQARRQLGKTVVGPVDPEGLDADAMIRRGREM